MSNSETEITILGSTGSIGTQTLDVIESHPDRFHAAVLTAGRNWELLARQALRHRPRLVVIADNSVYPQLKDALAGSGIETASGPEAIADAAGLLSDDIVVGAMVGYSGLEPTLRALEMGKTVALANKETLVAAGRIVTDTCRRTGARLLPVDSEHSAIFQCLQGESHDKIRKIILTASGGPFRTTQADMMDSITPEQALKHPNWDMGAKVTIDSASMMNKGLEMIEARWLFDVAPEDIEILVHPQSVVHSMVEYIDGSVKAQLGLPDMRMPIRYALGYPERLPSRAERLSLTAYGTLTFEEPDFNKFPLLGIAYQAIATGAAAPTVMNAANEVAVRAFLNRQIRFTDMPRVVRETMDKLSHLTADSASDIRTAHELATRAASELITL
ncbi:MAG: 1-deoxy-D-xylulose-5-phosphate reductoisomerase [Bacteroidales bacterium]|nr:1-deoxy-D-xylulose-5-phosphate reductoisomerase [Bacteroidales bacterium]